MKRLLTFTTLIEAATGIGLMLVPVVVVRLLLGAEIAGISVAIARVAGVAVFALGVACWPARNAAGQSRSAVRGMLVYNALVALYLLRLGIAGDWVGPLLWPAVALHGVVALLLARAWLAGSSVR